VKGFLLDTNIPSEMTRPRPAAQVEQWLSDVDDDLLFMSVMSVAEILRGIYRLPESQHRANLQRWLDETLRPWFGGRILPVSPQIAERLGVMAGRRDAQGKTLPFADGLLAATALEHDLTLVTRNVRDFVGLGVTLLNPWDL
jgi:predicted nucleic acid-binding protein